LTDSLIHGIVHIVNNKDENLDGYRSFLVLDEISKHNDLTQRALSKKLGFALGLINSYIKNLTSKGYITISTIPRKRYKYYLTPRGFREKTRLTYQHLQNFTNLYRVARRDFHSLFNALRAAGTTSVVFCGVDEVTEIAYLSLSETDLLLAGVVDDVETRGGKLSGFFGLEVRPIEEVDSMDADVVVITSFKGGDELKRLLMSAGVDEERIQDISIGGWLKRIES
jgi:DNA-binding MarR family transcriptional regulator